MHRSLQRNLSFLFISLLPAAPVLRLAADDSRAPRYDVAVVGDAAVKLNRATAINTAGDVVGMKGRDAYLYRNGTVTALGKLPGPFTYPYGINNRGQITGQGTSAENMTAAFFWENGRMKDLGLGIGNAINDDGIVAGDRYDPTTSRHRAAIWKGGEITLLGPGEGDSAIVAINARGDLAGNAKGRAVLWINGELRPIGPENSIAIGINDRGAAIVNVTGQASLFWESGVSTAVEVPAKTGKIILAGLNNAAQIVGTAFDAAGTPTATLWENGRPTDLNSVIVPGTGWRLREARAINDQGQIVGTGERDGDRLAFLLTPRAADKAAARPAATTHDPATGQATADIPVTIAAKRPYTVDDLLSIESFGNYFGGPFAFSPDGRKLAFTRVRAKKDWTSFKAEGLWGNNGGDVWLQEAPGQPARKLTNNDGGKAGWWAPQWSPDGARLAMLANRGGKVTLWIWAAATSELRQASSRPVNVANVTAPVFRWIDSSRIIVPLWNENAPTWSRSPERAASETALAGWEETDQGRTTTASRAESGLPSVPVPELNQLCLVGADKGSDQPIMDGLGFHFVRAPQGGGMAFVVAGPPETPKLGARLEHGFGATAQFNAIDAAGRLLFKRDKVPRNIRMFSVAWTPDGREIVAVGSNGSTNDPVSLYRGAVATGEFSETSLGDLLPVFPVLVRTMADGSALVHAQVLGPDGTRGRRADWWRIDRQGRRTNVTATLEAVPTMIFPEPGHRHFIGAVGAKYIVRLRPEEGVVENLTEKLTAAADLAWPVISNMPDVEAPPFERTYTKVILSVFQPTTNTIDQMVLDLASGQAARLNTGTGGRVHAFSPASGAAAMTFATNTETEARWVSVDHPAEPVVGINRFLEKIDSGQTKSIDYTSLDGEKLKATLLLPAGHAEGRRWPLIVSVYPGSKAPRRFDLTENHFLNMNIPAGRGYAVLAVTMPLPTPQGQADDVMLRLPNGVLPAVDAAIAQGSVDPDRLYLHGHSFGGYAVYGLVSLNSRFKAAVASAGVTNLISAYGQFRVTNRYKDNPLEDLWTQGYYESAQMRLAAPPWVDAERYRRNSPISYVGRVVTPLLIICGDMDYLGMTQSEEFFTSLYRQGKRARFVRYWGEGHNFVSPANLRDYWDQIIGWFDSFPANPGANSK